LGKTVTTEFAYFHPGKTANPHDTSRTPGGSSSGSAAAVADFMAPLGFGTQTVGSTIRPASYCGVVGYKPSFGLIDRTGVRPLADVFDTVGLFARDVEDMAYFASVLSRRPDLRLDGRPDTPPRIGLCRTPEWPAADPDSRAALETAAKRAAKAGADVREIDLPEVFAEVGQAQETVVDYQAATSAAYELSFHRDHVSDAYVRRAEAGMACSPEQYDAVLALLDTARHVFDAVMAGVDVLLMPSAPGEAPKGLQTTGDPVFNRLGTALRVPCLSVPGLRGASGMPVGVQLLGRMHDDRRVLAAGAWLFRV
ncbi:MAG: amidase, partial [Rhodospirillaceae bacterium]